MHRTGIAGLCFAGAVPLSYEFFAVLGCAAHGFAFAPQCCAAPLPRYSKPRRCCAYLRYTMLCRCYAALCKTMLCPCRASQVLAMPLLRFSTPRYAFAMRVCAALCRCLAVPRYAVPLPCFALPHNAVAVRFKAKPLPSSGMLCRCCAQLYRAIPSPRDAAVRFAVAICLMSSVLRVAMRRFAFAVHIDALPSRCVALRC